MSRTFFSAAFLSLAVSGAVCSPAAAQQQASRQQTASNSTAPATSEVARMRRLWETKGPKQYTFVYRAACDCYIRDAVRVTVENGRLTAAKYTRDDDWVAETFWVAFPTVEELFDQIEKAEREGTPVQVRYDRELGYPIDVTIGTRARSAGVRHTLSDLEPLATAREARLHFIPSPLLPLSAR